MMKNLKPIVLILALIYCTGVFAYDFSVTQNGQTIYFNIVSKTKKTALVTFNGSSAGKKSNDLKGSIEIPSKVKFKNVVYEITAVGPKAFADAKNLEGIVIPSGIESIEDFAFEGCSSLKNIIFPANNLKFGQGIFFKCNSITSVTIGSDWDSIDLSMFRWSTKLKELFIPAKIERIQGFKKLKYLKTISVDPNNAKFASYNGMLYSKNGKTLYGCPRGYSPIIEIMEGTEIVSPGALIDCSQTEKIIFPASIKAVSFRETSRMEKLSILVMKPINPIFTGYLGKSGKFLFQLCNPKTEIAVPYQSKSEYISLLPTEAGQYSVNIGSLPFEVNAKEIPTKKNIKGVKNFEKYSL